METETDMEVVYFPKDSRARRDRQTVRDTFPDMNNVSYNSFSQSELFWAVSLLFRSKSGNVFNSTVLNEIRNIVTRVKSVTASSDGRTVTFSDVCARRDSRCFVDGEYVLSPSFQAAVGAGLVTYPYWNTPAGAVPLFTTIGGVEVQAGVLVSATVLKLSFNLLVDTKAWQDKFLSVAHDFDPVYTEVTYETPDSLGDELDKSTSGDIWLFSLTITIMLTYASIVTAGGNPVSTRGMLANGGVLAAGLGILGSMGLLSLCGVKFVNIVGVIPFLVIGIGVDDMFLLMSSWSETLGQTDLSVPDRVGATFAGAGIGITITSITDFLAFCIGTTSVFRSVTYFSLYAGVAVLFCYICNATLFGGCLAYHGRRVYSSRHFATCHVTKPRDQLLADGHSRCFAVCCGGSAPTEDRGDESICQTKIEASRCFVWSEPSSDQYVQADLMLRMRDLADASSLPVFAYHAAFVAYEQFLAVLPATLQMVGCAVAVMFVVTFIFLPHLLMVMLVTLTIVMILVGIFGFMYYWDISLSSITMIHLVMSVGFSVDFSAHVCAAYLISDSHTREERAHDAITHAAGPILNGAVSTLLGVVLLVFSDSYIFTSFFRIMVLVIVFGMLHAVLFLPVVLSLIGPQNHPPSLSDPGDATCLGKISANGQGNEASAGTISATGQRDET
nr:hypothetical protein BaRGS_002773 [Batillaria attramentaria]